MITLADDPRYVSSTLLKIETWCGPVEWFDRACSMWQRGACLDGCLFGVDAPEVTFQRPAELRLDLFESPVRDFIVRFLESRGCDGLALRDGDGITAEESAGLLACSLARVYAGLPPVGVLLDHGVHHSDGRYTRHAVSMASSGVLQVDGDGWLVLVDDRDPPRGSSGLEIDAEGCACAESAARRYGLAMRIVGGLLLPWPFAITNTTPTQYENP